MGYNSDYHYDDDYDLPDEIRAAEEGLRDPKNLGDVVIVDDPNTELEASIESLIDDMRAMEKELSIPAMSEAANTLYRLNQRKRSDGERNLKFTLLEKIGDLLDEVRMKLATDRGMAEMIAQGLANGLLVSDISQPNRMPSVLEKYVRDHIANATSLSMSE